MFERRTAIFALFVCVLMLAGRPLRAAPTNGLAWDSVTKLAINADPASLAPGLFDTDFAAAAAVQPSEPSGTSGLPNQVRQAIGMGQIVQQMMSAGVAEHHYVAGAKERTDHLATQTATIVDCSAGTVTSLDLRAKTYKVVSMDESSAPSSGGGGSPASGNSDNSKVSISVTNTALGPRTVSGQATNGYRSAVTFTITDSTGKSRTGTGNLLAYYSTNVNPVVDCPGASVATGGRGPAAMLGGYSQLMRALATSGADSRFSLTQSGPPLPVSMLAMFDAFTFAGPQAQGATFLTERGHLRAISEDDPILSVPTGFKQQQ
jgi:hypothetical protein